MLHVNVIRLLGSCYLTSHHCLQSVYFQHKFHLNCSQQMFLSPVQCTLNTKFHVFMMKDKIVAEWW